MRRDERRIVDRAGLEAVIRESRVCRLGLVDGHRPYVVPLCFGYDRDALYVHCAPEGRKLDLLRRNPQVCVEFDVVGDLVEGDTACSWSIAFRSVIVTGEARILDDPAEKRRGLELLMAHYAPADRAWTFPDAAVGRTAVIRVAIRTMTGKRSSRQV